MSAGNSPRADRTRFIDAYLGVLMNAIYKPKRIEQPYRGPTPERRPTRVKGWRDTIGGAGWASPVSRHEHAKWTRDVKKHRAANAAVNAVLHDRGLTPSVHHKSNRTIRRVLLRKSAKHLGV